MKRLMLGFVLGLALPALVVAKDRAWQQGYWRDTSDSRVFGGAVVGVGIIVPVADTWQSVTIEASDHMTYVAKRRMVVHGLKRHKAFLLVVNDPVIFAVERDVLYVRGVDPNDASYEYRFDIVKRTRQP